MAGPAAEAYIIMRADGTLLPRDVKDFARDAGEEAGDDMGAGFEEAFEKRQEKTLRDFRNNVANSLETADFSKFRRKGESVEVVFKRLNAVMEDLRDNQMISTEYVEKYLDAFDKWRSIERSKQQLTELSEAINEQNKVADTYTKADVQRRERQAASMVNLGRQMEDLGDKSRQMIDRLAIPATLTGNWDSFIKKMGGLEQAQRTLKIRTDEVRKSNVAYADSMDEIEESLASYVKGVEEEIEATERANREKAEAKALTDKTTEATKAAKRADDERARSARQLAGRFKELTDATRETLDALIVEATIKDDWSDVEEHVTRLGLSMDDTGGKGKKFAATVSVVSERLRELEDAGALTEDQMSQVSLSIQKLHHEMETGAGRRKVFLSDMDKTGEKIGRVFGKGARNDFLNLFGTLVGGMAKFAAKAPVKLFGAMSEAVGETRKAFTDLTAPIAKGGAGMSRMAAIIPALMTGVVSLGTSLSAAVVTFIAVSVAVSALTSAISLLGGLIVILGQAIYLSLAAPLVALVPNIVAFGAGALVAAGAIAKWAENSGPLKRAMSDISDELDKVAVKIKPAADGLAEFFGEAGSSLVRRFGDSVQTVLTDLYKKLDDPSMDKFYSKWGVSMPKIFESLGSAISSFIVGLTAFFAPILPYAEKLADAIERTADRFAKWAKSAEGQNSIKGWMEDAWQAAKDLWSGLRDIGSALGNIFGAATGEGKNFAKWLRDIGERFEKWSESEEGRKEIAKWLKDAERFGKGLWKVITLLGQAFDALDSPSGRAALHLFVAGLQGMGAAALALATVMNWATTAVMLFFHSTAATIQGVRSLFEGIDWSSIGEGIKSGIQQALPIMGPWLLEKGREIFDSFIQGIKDRLGIASPSQVMIDLMADVGAGILQGLMAIPATLITAAMSIGSSLVSWVGQGLSTLGSVVSEKFNAAKDAVTQKASEIGSWVSTKFGEMPGRASEALSTLGPKVSERFEAARSAAASKASSLVSGAKSTLSAMGARASEALSNLGSKVSSRFETARSSAKSKASSLVSDARSTLSRMGNSASSALSNLSSKVSSRFESARSTATSKSSRLVSDARSKLSRMGSQASSALSNLSSQVSSRFTSAKSSAVRIASNLVSEARSRLSGMAGAVRSAFSGVTNAITSPFSSAYSTVSRILGQIRSAASQAASVASSIRMPSFPGIPWNASGGMYNGAQIVGVGEAGPEAIVPLNRPLAQVDPSVRWLSAIAQGMPVQQGGGGTTVAPGAIQVVTPYADPALVANQVLDQIVSNL